MNEDNILQNNLSTGVSPDRAIATTRKDRASEGVYDTLVL